MKILWLSHLLPYPPKAGVIQRSYHLIKQLSAAHQVDVLAFNQPELINPLVANPSEAIADAYDHLGKFCAIRGVYSIWSDTIWGGRAALALKGLSSPLGYTMNWLQSVEYKKAMMELLQKERYDLLHMDTISFFPYYRATLEAPVVLDHHNIESHMMIRRAQQEKNILKRAYFQIEGQKLLDIERLFCAQVQHNITCSDLDTARLLEIAPKSLVSTIPNGVDTEYFKADRQGETDGNLVFIGSMSWYPNIQAVEFLIKNIWPAVKARFPNLRLNIVGANAPDYLTSLAGSNSGVSFLGFVDDIRPLMNRALAFVCPISDGGGTKLKVLDALSMSLPLIAHPVACEGIEVVNGESVLFAESPQDYVIAIETLTGSPHLANSIGAAGRALVETRYSVNVVGKQVRDLYATIARDFKLAKRIG